MHTLCMGNAKALASLHIYMTRLSPRFFFDTAMSTSTKSNVLAHFIYSLLLVIINLA